MDVLFSKCTEAIERANTTKSYGFFYSEKHDANQDIHIHECCEILFCLSGGKTFFIDEKIYEVEDGDVFVINQFEAHKITSSPDAAFRRYVMQIHPSFLYDASTSKTDLSKCFGYRGDHISHKISLSGEEKEALNNVFDRLNQHISFGDDILKNICAIEILTIVSNLFFEKNKHHTYDSNYENKALVTAIKYINANFHQDITLDSIAKNCFISVTTLCSLFKTHIGTTVKKYIQSKRITEAKKLLESGESVSATAEKCGFQDYASFIRSFKRTVGVSPGKYKKHS
ncbi:MAG: helix-turn-helix transcriptional regulator [Clostridia bacterium]|nr:helix-turn-helix transcriptional regulator [Clostridia bacterium]